MKLLHSKLYERHTLEDIATFQYGASLPEKKRKVGEHPVFGSNGLIGTHQEYLVKGPGIIVGRKGSVGSVVWSDKDFWPIDTTYYVEPQNGHDLKWLYYLLTQANLERLSLQSGVPGLNRNNVYELTVEVPSYEQQQKIVAILSSIDEALEASQAVLEQLQHLKLGLVNFLFRAGMPDKNHRVVTTRIGELPSDWEILSLKELCHNIGVGIASSATHAYVSSGVPLLRNQNIHEGYIDDTDLLFVTPEFDEQYASKRIKEGDVVTIRTGYPGVSSVVPKKFDGCQTFTTLISRPKPLLNSYYLAYWINSEQGRRFVLSTQAGGAQKNLNVRVLEKMLVPLPSVEEQEAIVSILDAVDECHAVAKTKNHQLKIVKQGLMQQLLTGKLRVTV